MARTRQSFHRRLRLAREKSGMTEAQLAMAIGCPTGRQEIVRWEKGESAPRLKWLEPLSDALGVSIDFLVRGSR